MEPTLFKELELTTTSLDKYNEPLTQIKTASQWFCKQFPEVAKIYGAPFLENRITSLTGFSSSSPMKVNEDFMAGALGGDKRLGHSVVYWEPECQFYYYDPVDQLYYATSEQKLGDLMRALFMKCSQELQKETNIFPLVTTFRSDTVIKTITDRAKSILKASDDFFSATSPCSRVNGVELHERLARAFVEKALSASPSEVVLLGAAYERFAQIVRERDLLPIKRSIFKDIMKGLVREKFNTCLRNDLIIEGRYQQGWKDVGLNAGVVLN